jgi:CDP-glycerol glycerophosphotransferase (TagB/SpsB family)
MLKHKILGIGSPKLDKMKNTKKEDLEIPEEWLRVIEKSDGTWKKIVFYNTSINALLRHNGRMLKKIRNVFQYFKERQYKVALFWRPHPLIPNTIKSMRPELWAEYEKIERKYREEGWGIYDDSADLNRAIAISDAYYGDNSSVVNLYKKTGKPLMLQNVDEGEEL